MKLRNLVPAILLLAAVAARAEQTPACGEKLPSPDKRVTCWWASAGWKIAQDQPVPEKLGNFVEMSAAANEYEAAQLVVRPDTAIENVLLNVANLEGPGEAVIPAANINLMRVRYVTVEQPTDPAGKAGPWPDALPPLKDSVNLAANANQPFWVRVHVPSGAPAGAYTGTIKVLNPELMLELPVRVKVYGFRLPDRMTLTTALGFDPSLPFRYQGVTQPDQQRQVLDMYLRDFAAHHISPYNPAPLDPFVVKWPEEKDLPPEKLVPSIDWSAWDAAMTRAFDVYHFNSFSAPIQGMGGGTFAGRNEPELLGYKEDTPQYKAAFSAYCAALQDHFRQKGWLKDAYVYWFDEPEPRDYDFVMNGFNKLKQAAPDLGRMLTEQPEKALFDGPNTWCPISDQYKPEASQERQAAGDRLWWYICCGPKAPYAGEFIDHPGPELRVWLWQTWQRKISGILVWATDWWTSESVYTDPANPQDPYADTMSWTVGYGVPIDTKQPWGNGDGRFIYPPEAAANAHPGVPILEGPVDSVRWEGLRDGIEDYEYLVILRRLLAENRAQLPLATLAEYAKLLEVPAAITTDMTTFTKDPTPIEQQRDTIARAIERLSEK